MLQCNEYKIIKKLPIFTWFIFFSHYRIFVAAAHVWTMAPVKLDLPVKVFVVSVVLGSEERNVIKVFWIDVIIELVFFSPSSRTYQTERMLEPLRQNWRKVFGVKFS